MLSSADFFEDPSRFNFLFEAFEGLFKRLSLFDNNFRHAFFTPFRSQHIVGGMSSGRRALAATGRILRMRRPKATPHAAPLRPSARRSSASEVSPATTAASALATKSPRGAPGRGMASFGSPCGNRAKIPRRPL